MKLFSFLLCMFVSVSCFGVPELFFGPEDIPELREKIEQDKYEYIWRENFETAKQYINPESKLYCDPNKFIEKWSSIGWYDRMVHSRVEILGFATLMTDDGKYARHAVKILEQAAKQQDASVTQGVPHRGYAMGLDWCEEYMSAEQKRLISNVAAKYAEFKTHEVFSEQTWWYPYHNWIGVDLGGAGLVALKLRDEYPDKAEIWIRRCNEAVSTWFRSSFDRKGGQVEGTQYFNFGFTNALRYAIALKRIEGRDLLSESEIVNLPNFLAMSMLPGEKVFDARNDAHYKGVPYFVATMFLYEIESPLMAWLRENACEDKYTRDYSYPRGTKGFAPQRLIWDNDFKSLSPEQAGVDKSQLFPQRGLVICRTGWSKDDIMFSIEAGPYYMVTHNQADKGHFTLYGLGYRWAPDPGYGNNRTPGGRSQTDGHNCVLINGKGQMLSGAALGTNGETVRWYDDKQYSYSLADCTEAYNRTLASESHESSQWWEDLADQKDKSLYRETVKHAYRHSLFIKKSDKRPAYVIMFDDVEAYKENSNYTWQMITWPDIDFNITDAKITLEPKESEENNPRMELFINSPAELEAAKDIYSPGDHRKPASYPRVHVKTSDVDNPRFACVLVPLKAGQKSPKVSFSRDEDHSVKVVIKWTCNKQETVTCQFSDRIAPVVNIE